MSKPGGCHSSGISLGDALRLPKRHPAWRRREAQPGSCMERENLDGDAKGKGASGSNREAESTDAPARGGLNAGQGSFYRSQHELVGVFRVGEEAHLNNIQLGRHGRSRSNVWRYAGTNSFRAGRLDELNSHPTVKPVALIADAVRDCTRRGDIVLDIFGGSGTTILAAERVGRRACTLEIEPRFVDVAVKRWQAFSGKDAICAETGLSFDEIASQRAIVPAAGSAPTDVGAEGRRASG
jgi:DNA methylase